VQGKLLYDPNHFSKLIVVSRRCKDNYCTILSNFTKSNRCLR